MGCESHGFLAFVLYRQVRCGTYPFNMNLAPPSVAVVGTYPPTRCGIATFTWSLSEAMRPYGPYGPNVIRVLGADEMASPNPRVVANWRQGDSRSLFESVAAANCFDVVVVQHEFGIYGGRDGDSVLPFVEACEVPLVTVLHTVVPTPSPSQREIVERLARRSAAVVVQTMAARDRLLSTTNVDSNVVIVIPHGAELNLHGPSEQLAPAPQVLTWGLLGPGKGLEHGIDAMALLGDLVPAPTYVILGRTHPKVVEREGEAYRNSLILRAQRAGVSHRVVFDDSYRDFSELRRLTRGVDVVLLPYDSRDQVTSGVLVEAIAAGKPTVSTAFPHAVELSSRGVGLTVEHGNPEAMAAAMRHILTNPSMAAALRQAAEQESQSVAWPAVAARYHELIGRMPSVSAAS